MTKSHYCINCDYECCDLSNWNKHIKTNKHLGNKKISETVIQTTTCYNSNAIEQPRNDTTGLISGNKNISKLPEKLLECNACAYTCCKQSLLEKHNATAKHKKNEQMKQCGSLDYTSIITQLLSQNNELKNFIIEQANEHKKETLEIVNKVIEQAKSISNTTINNNSKAFNINMYLNEQCKDAMNFSDFINGIEVSHEDLENNAQLGFVGGVSKILIDNLKMMNRNERPIHCTDVKRETMYIKDDNKWTKEEDDSKLRSAIQEITRKSISTLMNWKRGNPESDDMDSKFSNHCIIIQQQSMAGYNREVYYPKVIHAIAREVLVNK